MSMGSFIHNTNACLITYLPHKFQIVPEQTATLLLKYKNSIKGYKTKVTEIAPFVDGIGTDAATNYNCYIQNLTELQVLNSKIDTAQMRKNKNIQQHNSIKQNYKAITENSEKAGKLAALKTASTKALAMRSIPSLLSL